MTSHKFIQLVKQKKFYQWLFILIPFYFAFYANTLHEKYPDEFDNILGGWYILHGSLPYSGFFSHHGPITYFLAAILTVFSGHSFVSFRIVYSFFLFGYFLGTFLFMRRSIAALHVVWYYFYFSVLFAFSSIYFWGHMLIADNLAAIFLIPVFALLLFKELYTLPFTTKDFIFFSILSFCALLSSLTFIYCIAIIYVFIAYSHLKQTHYRLNKQLVNPIIIFILPYVIFLLYLVITRSLGDYMYQSIIFNQKYYIYNYPGSSGSINPLRFAIVILHNFLNSYSGLLVQVRDFNLSYPFNITLALGNLAFLFFLVLKRKYSFSIVFFLLLVFANARSNPLDSSEKDYQSAVYILISLFTLCFLIPNLFAEVSLETHKLGSKILLSVFFIVVGAYAFFTVLFLFNGFKEKAFQKYMGNAPLIYDRPEIAPIINATVTRDEYMWIGPLEFEELYYAQGKLPSKYHILIPGIGRSEKIQQEMLADFEKNKPKLIYYDKTYSILGSQPQEYAKFFQNFLDENYITLYPYREGNRRFISVAPVTMRIDVETKLYINKSNTSEVITALKDHNIIKEVQAK